MLRCFPECAKKFCAGASYCIPSFRDSESGVRLSSPESLLVSCTWNPYRFVATAFLGILMGVIVIRNGSIYPAVLAHAINNALSFIVQKNEAWIEKLSWLNAESSELYAVMGRGGRFDIDVCRNSCG